MNFSMLSRCHQAKSCKRRVIKITSRRTQRRLQGARRASWGPGRHDPPRETQREPAGVRQSREPRAVTPGGGGGAVSACKHLSACSSCALPPAPWGITGD